MFNDDDDKYTCVMMIILAGWRRLEAAKGLSDDDTGDDDYNVIKPGLGQHVSQPQKMAYFSVLKPFYF